MINFTKSIVTGACIIAASSAVIGNYLDPLEPDIDNTSGQVHLERPYVAVQGIGYVSMALSLQYSSNVHPAMVDDSGQMNGVGLGWDFVVPHIEASYTNPFVSGDHEFTLVTPQITTKLIDNGNGTYCLKRYKPWKIVPFIDADGVICRWEVTDEYGIVRTYGNAATLSPDCNANMVQLCCNGSIGDVTAIGDYASSNTYLKVPTRWYLSKIIDQFGNMVTCDYIREQDVLNTTYPTDVSYTRALYLHTVTDDVNGTFCELSLQPRTTGEYPEVNPYDGTYRIYETLHYNDVSYYRSTLLYRQIVLEQSIATVGSVSRRLLTGWAQFDYGEKSAGVTYSYYTDTGAMNPGGLHTYKPDNAGLVEYTYNEPVSYIRGLDDATAPAYDEYELTDAELLQVAGEIFVDNLEIHRYPSTYEDGMAFPQDDGICIREWDDSDTDPANHEWIVVKHVPFPSDLTEEPKDISVSDDAITIVCGMMTILSLQKDPVTNEWDNAFQRFDVIWGQDGSSTRSYTKGDGFFIVFERLEDNRLKMFNDYNWQNGEARDYYCSDEVYLVYRPDGVTWVQISLHSFFRYSVYQSCEPFPTCAVDGRKVTICSYHYPINEDLYHWVQVDGQQYAVNNDYWGENGKGMKEFVFTCEIPMLGEFNSSTVEMTNKAVKVSEECWDASDDCPACQNIDYCGQPLTSMLMPTSSGVGRTVLEQCMVKSTGVSYGQHIYEFELNGTVYSSSYMSDCENVYSDDNTFTYGPRGVCACIDVTDYFYIVDNHYYYKNGEYWRAGQHQFVIPDAEHCEVYGDCILTRPNNNLYVRQNAAPCADVPGFIYPDMNGLEDERVSNGLFKRTSVVRKWDGNAYGSLVFSDGRNDMSNSIAEAKLKDPADIMHSTVRSKKKGSDPALYFEFGGAYELASSSTGLGFEYVEKKLAGIGRIRCDYYSDTQRRHLLHQVVYYNTNGDEIKRLNDTWSVFEADAWPDGVYGLKKLRRSSNLDGITDATTFLYENTYMLPTGARKSTEITGTQTGIEYVFDVTQPPYDLMTQRNMLKYEYMNCVKRQPDMTVLSGTITEYRNDGGIIVPSQRTEFDGANYYVTAVYDTYNERGNLTQMHTMHMGHPVYSCRIYDDNGTILTGSVQNAARDEVIYTSFEDGATDNVVIGPAAASVVSNDSYCGVQSLRVNGENGLSIEYAPACGIGDTRLLLSLWYKGSSTDAAITLTRMDDGVAAGSPFTQVLPAVSYWTNVTVDVTDAFIEGAGFTSDEYLGLYVSSVGGDMYIDDIRLLPADARLTAHTYDPVTKMRTSTTTPDLITTYFGYDHAGRLNRVVNEDGAIIKELTYKR